MDAMTTKAPRVLDRIERVHPYQELVAGNHRWGPAWDTPTGEPGVWIVGWRAAVRCVLDESAPKIPSIRFDCYLESLENGSEQVDDFLRSLG